MVLLLRCIRDARNRMDRFRLHLLPKSPETEPRFIGVSPFGLPCRDPALSNLVEPSGDAGLSMCGAARRRDGILVLWDLSLGWVKDTLIVDAAVELEDPAADGTIAVSYLRHQVERLRDLPRLVEDAISRLVSQEAILYEDGYANG